MIHYLWWIPTAMAFYIFTAWLSKQSQEFGGIYFWILACVPVPLWALVTRVSKNLVLDALIYDIVMLTFFYLGLMIFGSMSGFSTSQYIGLGIALCGLIIMKI